MWVKEATIEKPLATMLPTTSVMNKTQMTAHAPVSETISKFEIEKNEKWAEQKISALKN